MIDIKEEVRKAFNKGACDVSNCETAINLTAENTLGVITVWFDVDGNRRGEHDGSFARFVNGRVFVGLCEMVEGGGIEDIMVEELKGISIEDISPDSFKTKKQQIVDILIDNAGDIAGYHIAADKILKLFTQN